MSTTNRPKVSIVLDRLRSAFNTGNIFRLADAVQATEVIACGYTPYPPHPKLAKTAMGADEYVNFRHFDTSMEAVTQLKQEGYKQILAVETSETNNHPWAIQYDFPLAIVLGNEALGIQEETLKICDGIINLPMLGKKESINVGNCAAVVLYSIIAQLETKSAD